MKKALPLLFATLVACLILSSCSAKLFVIRPTLIDRIKIENLSSGESTELLRDQADEVDWLMDDLVLQMAEFYRRDGKCSDGDTHVYKAVFYYGDRLELSVIINEDGSVCKNEGHYVLTDTEEQEIEAFLGNWAKAFETETMKGDPTMNYEPFSLLEIDGDFTLTAEAGFRSDFFESYECQSTGDMLNAIVCYILRINDVDVSRFEFDSETGAFVMRSDDEEAIRKAAEILSREINRDEVLIAAMDSDEVREELELLGKIADSVSKILSVSDSPISGEEFLKQFNELFPGS